MHSNNDYSMDSINIQGKLKLLNFLGMDVYFEDGYRDWLYYRDKCNEKVAVLDVTGSYGINSLGHKNEMLQEEFIRFIKNGPPAFVQASSNPERSLLHKKSSDLLSKEIGYSNWIAEFANTGTEIIEAALKMAILRYNEKIDQIKQEINRSINKLSHSNKETRLILEKGREELGRRMCVLHLENSFHGKTIGSLSAMGNKQYSAPFPLAMRSCQLPKDVEKIPDVIEDIQQTYYLFDEDKDSVITKRFLPVVALLIEPIQGEAGVNVLEQDVVDVLFDLRDKYHFPIISDEIQCGLYRCGSFASLSTYGKRADIYCFGKALGGGLVKNSMLLADKNIFDEYFFRYHSTSFGEDSVSIHMSFCALNLLEKHQPSNSLLFQQLIDLKNDYPNVIKDVRGIGYMWAIEFDESFLKTSFVRKFLKDIDMLGYWISSVLLNKENIRALPTLSAPLTFRIQPSFFFGKKEMDFLVNGLQRLIVALVSNNTEYLFSHIMPISKSSSEKELSELLISEQFPKNAAVFLCHPIDIPHVRKIVDLLEEFDDQTVTSIINEMSGLQKYTPYHVSKITNSKGKQVDVVFLGIPYTSHQFYLDLRNGKRSKTIKVIQDAIDFANANSAKVIGLGQYTSIITDNGLSLQSDRAWLTTGNSYTAQSTLDALFMAAEEQNLELKNAKVGVLGASGNIISVITEALIGKVGHLSLVFNGNPFKNKRNREVIRKVLLRLEPQSANLDLLDLEVLVDFLEKDNIASLLTVHPTMDKLDSCDVIICGANVSKPILFPSQIKKGAIIVDIAVPANASKEVIESDQYFYIKGGIINLPETGGQLQALNSVIFPFELGESFACMAETIALAFEETLPNEFFGPLTLEKLNHIKLIMDKNGFKVKCFKLADSF
jgi:acetylornithine/succinyldiaminopimelate/putrescine aminotransferase/predicted amino acid dehydrogenase